MKITYKTEIKQTDSLSKEELIQTILKNRNISDIPGFLNPKSPSDIHLKDFGYTDEITNTLKILKQVKDKDGMIVVYTDYDADGITGGSILWETLYLLGFKVMPYVPHRQHEGYGFSIKGIDAIKAQYNPSLIISVDHGITAREKVSYAKSLGIPVIITDHHLKPDLLPDDAQAIFHIPQLSGSGVSYFFSKMLFEYFGSSESINKHRLEHNFQYDFLALASIGTIADLVPLVDYSRSVVKYGLDSFRNVKRAGIQHILKQAKIENRPITPYEVGFMIAPRINAIGRLSHAMDALRLLCTTSDERAQELASQIGKTNQDRQGLVKQAVEEAKKIVESTKPVKNIILLVSENWHEGIIGLIASRIVEEYYRPVIVMTKANGFYKGSARSIPALHMTDFLRSLKHHLIDVGGHSQAAGFTIEAKNVNAFIEEAHLKVSNLVFEKDLEKIIETDLKIPISKLNLSMARSIEQLNPFGVGNPNPTFYSEVELMEAKLFGKKNEHLKIYVKDVQNASFPLELISFSNSALYKKLTPKMKMQIPFSLEIDRWSGTERLRGRLIKS